MSSALSSSGLLPLPGSPSSSWAIYRERLSSVLKQLDWSVVIAFWLFGLINNVLYVIILSAAQDLVGSDVPKGVVLLADVMPSFVTKLVAPYFIHRVPYAVRIWVFVALSTSGMLVLAYTPQNYSATVKLVGILLASFSSGGGELSFLGLTHYYGPLSLAAWGSGTGGAGLVGAGLYVMLTGWVGFTVKTSLLVSACLPCVMLLGFFIVLPHGPLRHATLVNEYAALAEDDGPLEGQDEAGNGAQQDPYRDNVSSTLPSPANPVDFGQGKRHRNRFVTNLMRSKSLFLPYMVPLLLVYIAEYTINQGVAPTLLFPLRDSPFVEFRSFYPFYGFLYQLGVFVSRSSTPFYRMHKLYLPSLLQVVNLVVLTLHALFNFIPSVYIVFLIVFWEGLLGGAVYVNTFAEILDNVPLREREFSLGATSVSDSGGICIAGFIGMAMEVWLCKWQVKHGRDWCTRIEPG